MKTESPITLAGRKAIVSGGAGNIGRAICNKLAAAGMAVAVLGRNMQAVTEVAEEIGKKGGTAYGVRCDVSRHESICDGIAEAARYLDGIDVVINNAGVLDMARIEEQTPTHWNQVMDVNLRGAFFLAQAALPYLERSQAPRIINISSNSGRMGGFENGMAYSASKGGMIAVTYGLARQLAPKKITVNCVAPGTIDSEMLRARDEATQARLLTRFPLGRFGHPEEVAAAVCYFASEEAAFTTGAVLDVNGGLFMG